MEKKEKKRMSPKTKKIISIIITSLQVAIVVATVVVSIFVWTTTGRGETEAKAMQILAIRSNSMTGDRSDSFNSGDLVIIKRAEDTANLAVGTVITYRRTFEGGTSLVTHRIHEIIQPTGEGGNIRYATKGDNTPDVDASAVQPGDIVGVYSFKLSGVGGALLWLQGYKRVPIQGGYGWDYAGNTNNFLWVIIIPLIALLLWNGYALIKVIVDGKLKKAREEAAAAAAASVTSTLDAEEIKRRAIEEYLASMKASDTSDATPKAETAPEPKEEAADIAADIIEADKAAPVVAKPIVKKTTAAKTTAAKTTTKASDKPAVKKTTAVKDGDKKTTAKAKTAGEAKATTKKPSAKPKSE